MTERNYEDAVRVVEDLTTQLGENDSLGAWRWSDEPRKGLGNQKKPHASVRLPKGFSLEKELGCRLEEIKGLTEKFQTNDETTYYHFKNLSL